MGGISKGGVGKGGVGKGGGAKKGLIPVDSTSGQVTMCFDERTLSASLAALDAAVQSGGLGEGCLPGMMIVRMDLDVAQGLFAVVLSGLGSGVSKKKKKGKGGTLVVGPITGKKKKVG